jgi:hypothetical protein
VYGLFPAGIYRQLKQGKPETQARQKRQYFEPLAMITAKTDFDEGRTVNRPVEETP